VFGCPVYVNVNKEKLEPRSKKGIFIGYPNGVKGYKVWLLDLKSPKVVINRDVIFDESAMLHPRKESVVSSDTGVQSSDKQVEIEIEVESMSSSQTDSISFHIYRSYFL
jgi:hypothetical protein